MIKIIKGPIFSIIMLLMTDAALAFKRVSVYKDSQTSISQMSPAGNICKPHLEHIEKKHGIPSQLLTAIAQVESGRWNKVSKKYEPWPWTIHAEGKGHFFASKAEAIHAVRELLNRGITNIDVGCMQINIGHHGHAFQTLSDMFDPRHNVAYAGKFLKSLKGNSSTWSHAVAHYHSATPLHHIPYRKKVYKALAKARYENFGTNQDNSLFDISDEESSDLPPNRFLKAKSSSTHFDIGDEIGATSYHMRSLKSGDYQIQDKKASPQRQYGLVGARRLTTPAKLNQAGPMHVAYSKRIISRPIMLADRMARGKKYIVPQRVR